jgi:hypothetical protein
MESTRGPANARQAVAAAAVFAFTFVCRVRGVSDEFWLLGDQIRDWGIALRPFTQLPLIGPPTHAGGYTIGPAYYWLMWLIRVTLGPWFDYLPHGGGFGQAIVASAADALLLVAVWRRTASLWLALAAVLAIATAAYDMALSAIVWTCTVASAFGKVAIALILLRWHDHGLWRVAIVAAVAWMAVHIYMGAIFVTVGVLLSMLAEAAFARDWRSLARRGAVIASVVGALQIPWLLYQVQTEFGVPAMGAVTGSIWRVLSGEASPQPVKSITGLTAAFNFIQVSPWQVMWMPWVVLVASVVVAARYRRDLSMVILLLAPLATAIVGYALFFGTVDHYTYIPIVPPMVLTVPFALALPWRQARTVVGLTLLVGVSAIIPARLQLAATQHKLPEYRVLVDASRRILATRQPMRAVVANFPLPETAESDFLYRLLGGHIDPNSSWMAIIGRDGQLRYQQVKD